jgi:hypothetical protein
MDGVHDMGGMQGFGAVDPTDELRWSKADWRARMFAIELSYTQPGGANVDWLRHVLECMPPAVYLGSEYFDRWYWRDAGVLANADWVDIEELRTGKAANRPADAGEPLSPEAVPAILEQGVDSGRGRGGAGVQAGRPGACQVPFPLGGDPAAPLHARSCRNDRGLSRVVRLARRQRLRRRTGRAALHGRVPRQGSLG